VSAPYIVGIGGTLRTHSTSELALRCALDAAARAGARTALISGSALQMGIYEPGSVQRCAAARHLVQQIAQADGIVLASPGYHGSISGLVKNALDYAEDLRDDVRPYFTGRPVGCIATASGYQAAVSTLGALRDVVHALRGWPTPMGGVINSSEGPVFGEDGSCRLHRVAQMLEIIAEEIVEFALSPARARGRPSHSPSGSEGGDAVRFHACEPASRGAGSQPGKSESFT
jgi:FMN reductase